MTAPASSATASSEGVDQAIRPWQSLPGPRGWPVVGVALNIDEARFHLILEDWYRQHGGPFVFRLGPRPFVAIAEPDALRELLHRRPESFARSQKVSRAILELGAEGVFSAEGEDWKRQRPLFSRAFQPQQLRVYFSQIVELCARLRERWMRAAETGEVLDIQKDFERFTTDVMLRVAFGYESNALGNERDQLQDDMGLVFPELNRRIRAPFPLWRWFKTPRTRRVTAAIERIRGRLSERVDQVRAELSDSPERRAAPENILEAIIAAELDEEGQPLRPEQVFGNVLTALLAGEDTTAHTLAWITHEMTRTPEIQARLRREVDERLAPAPGLRAIEDMRSLRYLEGVAREAIRVRGVAPFMFMDPLQETNVGDVRVGPEVGVVALTRLAGLHPDYFSDGERFLPERWLREDTDVRERCPVHETRAAMGFGGGPRICPGRGLAMLEIHAVMSTLARSFDVEAVSDPDEVREHFAFTMSPEGLRVRVRRRTDAD